MGKHIKYTKAILEEAVKNSKSWREVCEYLGLAVAGGTQANLKRRADEYGLDCSHFPGKLWNIGREFEKRPLEVYFSNQVGISSDHLKKRMIREGLKEHKCEHCDGVEWQGKPIPIELDHINGDSKDNRFDNLRILCPNCHALTETYCRKKLPV